MDDSQTTTFSFGANSLPGCPRVGKRALDQSDIDYFSRFVRVGCFAGRKKHA